MRRSLTWRRKATKQRYQEGPSLCWDSETGSVGQKSVVNRRSCLADGDRLTKNLTIGRVFNVVPNVVSAHISGSNQSR